MRKCENNEGQCMKIAIMQPYLFPYIGYWQLINAVDEFVLLDDVNYIMPVSYTHLTLPTTSRV